MNSFFSAWIASSSRIPWHEYLQSHPNPQVLLSNIGLGIGPSARQSIDSSEGMRTGPSVGSSVGASIESCPVDSFKAKCRYKCRHKNRSKCGYKCRFKIGSLFFLSTSSRRFKLSKGSLCGSKPCVEQLAKQCVKNLAQLLACVFVDKNVQFQKRSGVLCILFQARPPQSFLQPFRFASESRFQIPRAFGDLVFFALYFRILNRFVGLTTVLSSFAA